MTRILVPAHNRPAVVTLRSRNGRVVLRSVVGAGVVAVITVGMAGSAFAQTDGGSTDANVEVSSAISLTGLTPSFTLSGLPGATVLGTGVVEFNVNTNNLAGYAVTVQSQTATMVADTAGNLDSIPIGALSVRETGTTPFTALSSTVAATVHSQDTRSAELGDDLVNDYQVVIPFVNEDNYDATLDYVATAL